MQLLDILPWLEHGNDQYLSVEETHRNCWRDSFFHVHVQLNKQSSIHGIFAISFGETGGSS